MRTERRRRRDEARAERERVEYGALRPVPEAFEYFPIPRNAGHVLGVYPNGKQAVLTVEEARRWPRENIVYGRTEVVTIVEYRDARLSEEVTV